MADERKLMERTIPGMNRHEWFVEVEHAENVGGTLKRIGAYFAREKTMVLYMLGIVALGTVCGVGAPSFQSSAIDIIAGESAGNLLKTIGWMLALYLIYSLCQLVQGLISAQISQRLVGRMRQELFGKIVDMPFAIWTLIPMATL